MLRREDVSHVSWSTTALWILCALSAWAHISSGITPFDDAFIHFRIADNWVKTGVPFFNPSESVYGTSSPFFVLLLFFGCLFRISPTTSAGIICGVSSILASFYWGKLPRTSLPGSRLILTCALLVIQLPVSFGLMETSLSLACAGFGLFSASAPFVLRFFFIALAVLGRPEFSILIFFFTILEYRSLCNLKAGSWLFLIIGVIAYGTITIYFFSSLVPHTLAAKRLVYEVTPSQIIGQLFEYFIGEGAPKELRIALHCLVFIGFLTFGLLISFSSLKGPFFPKMGILREEFCGIGFSVLTLTGYMVSGVPLFPWYAPLLIVPFLRGLASISVFLSRAMQLFFLSLILSLSVLVGVRAYLAALAGMASSPWYPSNERIQSIAEIAREIGHLAPDALIASPEIGALGYYSNLTILDGVGLVSPESLKFHPIPIPEGRRNGLVGSLPLAIVDSRKPDYIVGVSNLVEGSDADYQALGYKRFRVPVFSERIATALLKGGFETYLSSETILLYALNSRPIPPLAYR